MKDLLDIVETMEGTNLPPICSRTPLKLEITVSWSEHQTNATDYIISAAASLMSVFREPNSIFCNSR